MARRIDSSIHFAPKIPQRWKVIIYHIFQALCSLMHYHTKWRLERRSPWPPANSFNCWTVQLSERKPGTSGWFSVLTHSSLNSCAGSFLNTANTCPVLSNSRLQSHTLARCSDPSLASFLTSPPAFSWAFARAWPTHLSNQIPNRLTIRAMGCTLDIWDL